jgi:hypothetical protein
MKFVKNRACGVSGYGGPVGHGDFLLATDEQREMALPGAASAAAGTDEPEQVTGSGTPFSSCALR